MSTPKVPPPHTHTLGVGGGMRVAARRIVRLHVFYVVTKPIVSLPVVANLAGVFVRPRPYRAVLMDQDVAHRLSTPSASAGRPRYSLVWKLVMLPKPLVQRGSITSGAGIARKEWGQPVYFGSAAHVVRVAKETAAAAAAAASETCDHFE